MDGNDNPAEQSHEEVEAAPEDALAAVRKKAVALLDEGEELGGRGDFQGAREKFEQVFEEATEHGLPGFACRALDRIASAHWEMGNYDAAEGALRRAEALAEVVASDIDHAYAQYRLAWILAETERYSEPSVVFELLASARAGMKEAGNPAMVAECDEKAAIVYANEGNHRKSAEFYDRAASVFEALGLHERALLVRANEAKAIGSAGDPDLEIAMYQSLLAEAEERGILATVKGAGTYLAEALLARGATGEAATVLDKIEPFFVRYPNVYETAQYLTARACLALDTKKLDDAHGLVDRVFGLAEQLSTSHRFSVLGEAFEVLGRLRLMEKKEDAADVAFAQSVLNFVKNEDVPRAIRVAQSIRPDAHKQKPRKVPFGFVPNPVPSDPALTAGDTQADDGG